MYSAEAMNHFLDPQHAGVLDAPSGRGEAVNEACGDTVLITIRIAAGQIVAARFSSQACAGGIAACSATVQWAHGKSTDEAAKLSSEVVATLLGGLPVAKMGCAEMAATALKNAVVDAK